MTQRMILNETSWFGRGCRSQLINELTRRGFSRALIVTDNGLVKCGIVEKITTLLDKADFAWSLFDRVVPNPGITVVQEGVEKFRASGADVLIAIGGGSPQDTCKAIGIIINNPEFADVRSLEGFAETTRPCVPIIALPTTAGTAAEVTINYVITDEENQRKFVCIDPHDIPQVALVDADLMDAMPGSLKAATGIDALTHAIEGYITRGAWELPDALHLKAIEMIAKSLRSAVAGDAEAMEKMALAQYIAGMGFSNVVSASSMAWRIRLARFTTRHTVSPMPSCCLRSWHGMRPTPERNTATSRWQWPFPTPPRYRWSRYDRLLSMRSINSITMSGSPDRCVRSG